ncbi:MAG: hypothetical protein IT249_21010 [Chitinophagaceae bacterium]|nr:hypothetical protein [Chitinophagaceae bacterium]
MHEKKKELTIRHGLGEIDRATYELTLEHLTDQMEGVYKELNIVPKKISNLESLLKNSLQKLANIRSMWSSSGLDYKRRIQNTLFPEGIFYDAKNHQYLTKKINGFLFVTIRLSNEYGLNKNGDSQFY